jgi:putative peptidoglycan lipid II flippase
MDGEYVIDGFTRSLVASGLLALVSWSVWRVLDDALGRSLGAQLVTLTCAAAAGIVAYVTAAHAMSMPELRALARLTRPLR